MGVDWIHLAQDRKPMACSRENDNLEGATRGGYSADGQ